MPSYALTFHLNGVQLAVSTVDWRDAAVDALVLSTNNQMVLRGATGSAGWINEQCPLLNDLLKRMVAQKESIPGRGLLPGNGLMTRNGPGGRTVIHAVTVDYDNPHMQGRPYAGIDTVAAATSFAVQTALELGVESIAIHPMCTQGQADACLPSWMATELHPQVQAQVIWGRIAIASAPRLKQVLFCAPDEPAGTSKSAFQIVADTWRALQGHW